MTNVVQIPNLPQVASVGGNDLYYTVQNGVSYKVDAAQIAAYVISVYPFPLPSVVDSLSFGTTGLTPSTATGGNIVVSGTLNAAHGGTGLATYTVGDLLVAATSTTLTQLSDVATGNVLLSGGVGAAPSYGKVSLTAAVSGTLPIASGGTGQITAGAAFNALSPITLTGDLIVGNGANSATRLGIGTTGYALIVSGGTAAWGQVALAGAAIGVTGTLAATNGGTGNAVYAVGDLLYASTTTALSRLADVATGSVLISGGVGVAPAWSALSGIAVTTLSFGTTGLTPNSATSGVITVGGTLNVANGGSGAATLTGVLKGNGTSAFTAATAGTDYVAPGTATTFTATQTLNGSSSTFGAVLLNAAETTTVSATAATGTIAYYVNSQSVLYYTSNASANWTLNVAFSSGTTLNAALSTGQSVTIAFLVTQGGTAYYNATFEIDGATSGVTVKWQGGTAPAAGNINGIDVYVYTIIKTGSATYTVLATLTQF